MSGKRDYGFSCTLGHDCRNLWEDIHQLHFQIRLFVTCQHLIRLRRFQRHEVEEFEVFEIVAPTVGSPLVLAV